MPRKKGRLIPLLKVGVWIGALTPFVLLVRKLLPGSFVADPVKLIHHDTGVAALVLLFLTLLVTPIRKVTGWHKIIRFRRLLGLFAFFYVFLHATSYFAFDHRFDPVEILEDVKEHTWVLAGFSAFVLLIPLAVTSTSGWIRRLGGKRWSRIHSLIYPATALGVLHYYWLVKIDVVDPLYYAGALGGIFLLRSALRLRDRYATGRSAAP